MATLVDETRLSPVGAGATASVPLVRTRVKGEQTLAPWQAYAIVFTASACTLVIELLAGRLMAPQLGVSIYTWTSIIGIVLAGMTLGNFVGGRLADRRGSRVLLSRVFLASAGSCLVLVAVSGGIFRLVSDWPLPIMFRILVASAFVFFIPSFLLGTTTPQVVKLTLTRLDTAGRTVGSIYATSAFGSIIGTFVTGFVLIDYVGTVRTLWWVCGVLFICGILIRERLRPSTVGFILFLVTGLAAVAATDVVAGPCAEETSYFCIRTVTETAADGTTVTRLVLDQMIHTSLDLSNPASLDHGYAYERLYADLSNAYFTSEPTTAHRLMVIGAGGFSFPRYMLANHPEIPIDVIEIDPGVVDFNHEQLKLPDDDRISIHAEDARTYFNFKAPDQAFGVVQLDAFNDFGVPYHLTTVEFARSVRESMVPGGLFMTNLIDSSESGMFLQAYANTLHQVFPVVTIYVLNLQQVSHHQTYVVVGSDSPALLDDPEWTRLAYNDLGAMFPEQTDLILTDDFAPTDRLLRPIFDR